MKTNEEKRMMFRDGRDYVHLVPQTTGNMGLFFKHKRLGEVRYGQVFFTPNQIKRMIKIFQEWLEP